MPKGPQGQKRPADVIVRAVTVARIATGEEQEVLPPMSGRVRSGHAGARARSEKLTQAERSEIAKKAAGRVGSKEATIMSFIDRLFNRHPPRYRITLNREKRDGGYTFISSPELKGFTLLLEPGDYDNFKNFIDATFDPLTNYLAAFDQARDAARRERPRLRSAKINEDDQTVAEMCFQ
jgi:hypothetical protein